jgi:hypothetical protein
VRARNRSNSYRGVRRSDRRSYLEIFPGRNPIAYAQIQVEIKAGVATTTLNRPEKLNVYTAQMGTEIHDAFAALDANDDARVSIVTGAARALCAGADLDLLIIRFLRNQTAAAGLCLILLHTVANIINRWLAAKPMKCTPPSTARKRAYPT